MGDGRATIRDSEELLQRLGVMEEKNEDKDKRFLARALKYFASRSMNKQSNGNGNGEHLFKNGKLNLAALTVANIFRLSALVILLMVFCEAYGYELPFLKKKKEEPASPPAIEEILIGPEFDKAVRESLKKLIIDYQEASDGG